MGLRERLRRGYNRYQDSIQKEKDDRENKLAIELQGLRAKRKRLNDNMKVRRKQDKSIESIKEESSKLRREITNLESESDVVKRWFNRAKKEGKALLSGDEPRAVNKDGSLRKKRKDAGKPRKKSTKKRSDAGKSRKKKKKTTKKSPKKKTKKKKSKKKSKK